MTTSVLATQHSDLISALAFSSHGTRLATASLDHTVRVCALSPTSGQWDEGVSEFKAHDAPVLAVAWADPSFGALLASGGTDGVVKVWADEPHPNFGPRAQAAAGPAAGAAGVPTSTRRWTAKAVLTDARGSVRALAFAPAELGLKLAAVSADSHLRVWECLDPVGLADWSLVHDVDLDALSDTPAAPARGFDNTASPTKPPAPSTSLASTASSGSSEGRLRAGAVESDGGWALAWCAEAWWGERLAVSSGSTGIIRLFHLPDHAPATNFLSLLPPRTFAQTPPVSSLAWAPASGRSYQLLASGARDGRARVWRVHPSAEADEPWTGEMDAELDEGVPASAAPGVVHVGWNVTGTVLSTSGEDAKVRLWKSTYTGQWRTIAVISTEDGQDGMAVDK